MNLNVLVPDELLAAIDAAAAERSLNRSEFVRWVMGCVTSAVPCAYEPPTLPNWQVEAWTLLLRGIFGDERLVLTDRTKTVLMGAMSNLNAREAQVLSLRFGLDGPRYTLAEAGAIMGWNSRQRALQVEQLALARVRGWCRGRGIWELLKGQLELDKNAQ